MFVCVAHALELCLEFGAVAFELFCEFLGHGEGFEGVVALSFCAVQTFLEVGCVDFLFVDEHCKTVGLAFVLFDLRLEFLCFLRKLRSERLEFFELLSARYFERCTCCFQFSSSSTRKLLRFVTLATSLSIRVL